MTHDVVLVLLVYHLLTSTILVPFVAQEKGRSALGGAIGALIFFAPIPVLIALAAPLSLFLSSTVEAIMRPSALGLLLAAGLLSACATTHDVSPGFQQAEGGTILIVSGRSLEDVWPAALRGATVVSQTGHQTLATPERTPEDGARVIAIEGKDVVGWLVSYWVAIHLQQRDEGVRITVSKWYRYPWALIKDGPSEDDYLRAIQRELAPR